MVLGGRLPGRVGRRRDSQWRRPPLHPNGVRGGRFLASGHRYAPPMASRDHKPKRVPKRRPGDGGFGPYRQDDEGERPREQRGRAADDSESRPPRPSHLRVVRGGKGSNPAAKSTKGTKRARKRPAKRAARTPPPHRRRRTTPGDVRDEILRLGGSRGPVYYDQLTRAADAFQRDHERDAIRILRPLREELPESPSVR